MLQDWFPIEQLLTTQRNLASCDEIFGSINTKLLQAGWSVGSKEVESSNLEPPMLNPTCFSSLAYLEDVAVDLVHLPPPPGPPSVDRPGVCIEENSLFEPAGLHYFPTA